MKDNRNETHLTSKEISQWLVEGASPQSEEHMQSCWACQAKLAEAREPLSAFRAAVVAWSEAQPEGRERVTASSGVRQQGFRVWAPAASIALAAMVLAGILTVSGVFRNHPVIPQVAHTPAGTDSDAVLMDQVDAEVSEAVPDALAPLTDLVAWDSSEATAAHAQAVKRTAKAKPPTITKTKAVAAD